MTPRRCSARVARLCADAESRLAPGPARDDVAAVRQELAEPLRVAVAGRVSSGKSTLVNALLNQDIAPTAAGECTRVVTWFSYGVPAEASLFLASGSSAHLSLEPGPKLPARLDVDPSDIDRIEVRLGNDALRSLSVIDTPGLASSNDEFSEAARRALSPDEAAAVSRRTHAGARHADALIYVLTGIAQEDEVRTLEAFRGQLGGMQASAINTVAVLNKADILGEDDDGEGDALDRAKSVAKRLEERLAGLAAAVIPTVGLVAETVESGRVSEGDARALARLAALDPTTKRRLLLDQRWFATMDCEIPADVRARLLGLLGLYGVRRCISWNEERPQSAHELTGRLIGLSGLAQLQGIVRDLFERRADVLKAANALARLERVVAQGVLEEDEGKRLAHEVERARLEPEMHALATAWALAEVEAKSIELPAHLADDLRRVALGTTLAEQLEAQPGASRDTLREVAARRSGEWRAFANSGCRVEQQRIAGVMYEQHAALWQLAGEVAAR